MFGHDARGYTGTTGQSPAPPKSSIPLQRTRPLRKPIDVVTADKTPNAPVLNEMLAAKMPYQRKGQSRHAQSIDYMRKRYQLQHNSRMMLLEHAVSPPASIPIPELSFEIEPMSLVLNVDLVPSLISKQYISIAERTVVTDLAPDTTAINMRQV